MDFVGALTHADPTLDALVFVPFHDEVVVIFTLVAIEHVFSSPENT
jgi:hypothetical protein